MPKMQENRSYLFFMRPRRRTEGGLILIKINSFPNSVYVYVTPYILIPVVL